MSGARGQGLFRFELATLCASGVTLVIALAAWTLMRFGVFSLLRTFAVGVVVATGTLVASRRALRRLVVVGFAEPTPSRIAMAAAVSCLGFGVLYAWYPTYFLLGGQDPGPYLAFAARIAKTGGLNLGAPAIEEWARAHGSGLVRWFPAVYGYLTDQHAGHALQAQFLHLFTAFDALFFAFGGVEGAVRANAWLAVLCLATGFALVRRLETSLAGFAFLIVLGFNPAFVWASRITLTEVLALWLNLSGLLLLALAWDRAEQKLGAVAGCVFGLGVLDRLDGGMGSLAVLGFAVAASLGGHNQRRAAVAAAVGHLATSLFAYGDARVFSSIYCQQLAEGSSTAVALPWLTSGLDVAALALMLLWRRVAPYANETRLRMLGYAAVWASLGWVALGITLRPLVDHGDDGRVLRHLTWYVGWASWPLIFGGLALAIGAVRFTRWLPLVTLLLGTLFVYTARTEVAPIYMWASRRWVPHVIPLLLAVATLAAAWTFDLLLSRRRHRSARVFAAVLVALAWLLAPLDFDRPFLFRSMLAGLPQAYERIAQFARAHRDRWPVITDQVNFGSILTYVYDVPTVVLNDAGQDVLARGGLVDEVIVGVHPFGRRESAGVLAGYEFPYLSITRDERPSELMSWRFPLEAGLVGPLQFTVVEAPASHPAFRHQVGRVAGDGSVVSEGHAGQLLSGPFVTLAPGRYRVEWYGHFLAATRHKHVGTLDVIFKSGRESLGETPLLAKRTRSESALGAVEFSLEQVLDNIEFRVRIARDVRLALTNVRLERLSGP